MKRSNLIRACVLLALTWAVPAFAYIPPASYIVKTMAEKHGGVKGLKIRSAVIALDGDKAAGPRFTETALYDASTGLLRSRALDESGKELFAQEIRLTAESIVSDFGTLISGLLLSSHPDVISGALVRAGILRALSNTESSTVLSTEGSTEGSIEPRKELTPSFLHRTRGTVVWAIGAHPRKAPNASQLWVEKDTFLPLHLVVARAGGEGLEADFGSYKLHKEFPYPNSYRVIRGTEPRFRVELVELVTNPPELTSLKRPLSPPASEPKMEDGVRDLVREFYDLAR